MDWHNSRLRHYEGPLLLQRWLWSWLWLTTLVKHNYVILSISSQLSCANPCDCGWWWGQSSKWQSEENNIGLGLGLEKKTKWLLSLSALASDCCVKVVSSSTCSPDLDLEGLWCHMSMYNHPKGGWPWRLRIRLLELSIVVVRIHYAFSMKIEPKKVNHNHPWECDRLFEAEFEAQVIAPSIQRNWDTLSSFHRQLPSLHSWGLILQIIILCHSCNHHYLKKQSVPPCWILVIVTLRIVMKLKCRIAPSNQLNGTRTHHQCIHKNSVYR